MEILGVLSLIPTAVTLALSEIPSHPRLSWSSRFSPIPRDARRRKSTHQGPLHHPETGEQLRKSRADELTYIQLCFIQPTVCVSTTYS